MVQRYSLKIAFAKMMTVVIAAMAGPAFNPVQAM